MSIEPAKAARQGRGCYRGDSRPLYYNPFPVNHRRVAVQEGTRSSTGHLLYDTYILYVSIYVCISTGYIESRDTL
jgi:hypothetical protein